MLKLINSHYFFYGCRLLPPPLTQYFYVFKRGEQNLLSHVAHIIKYIVGKLMYSFLIHLEACEFYKIKPFFFLLALHAFCNVDSGALNVAVNLRNLTNF